MQQLGAYERRASLPGEPPDPSCVVPRVRPFMTEPGMPHPELDVLVEEIAGLRPLPPVAARVLSIAESEHFSAHELAQAISSDPALTARTLRLANSAYYGFPRRITTVRDAVVLLGFRAIRSSTLAACVINTLPQGNRLDQETFWRFSVTVAMLAEVLARAAHRPTDEAFTAGILHNIGRLALDQHRPAEFQRVQTLAAREDMTLHAAQRALLGFTDADVGGALALHWNFPPDLAVAVAQHHRKVGDLDDPESVASFVIRARAYAHACGLTDGADIPVRTAPAPEWSSPPIRPVLDQGGGLDGLVERAAVFLQHTVGSR